MTQTQDDAVMAPGCIRSRVSRVRKIRGRLCYTPMSVKFAAIVIKRQT